MGAEPPLGEPFDLGDLRGEIAAGYRPEDLAGEVRRLLDPAAARATVHWGRNYLYRAELATPAGPVAVVVKQFRRDRWLERQRRRWGGDKALRSWRMAHAFRAAGLQTAEPVIVAWSAVPSAPSFFVSRWLDDRVEARYLLRAANAGRLEEAFPGVDFGAFLDALAGLVARMHGAGLLHRDLSIGNVLFPAGAGALTADDLVVVDLNRARRRRRLGVARRSRDLCRLAIFRPSHRRRFLVAYWGGPPGPVRVGLYRLFHAAFHAKVTAKKRWRGATRTLAAWLLPRRAHAHIPEAAPGASRRDAVVWDRLSDQPHQHAGRLAKLVVRLADTRSHAASGAALLGAAPAIWRRYRELRAALYRQPVPFSGVGVCVRPYPEDPPAVARLVAELGVRHALLRLHPWEEDHRAEEELAQELSALGVELAFALPQRRELVLDRERWRAAVAELAERFTPYGRAFQVGQAVNRSKWGVWTPEEYFRLARDAAAVLRRTPGVLVLGPAVIDFEAHVTAAWLNHPGCGVRFDGLASLLYVDRRGAPERRQLGFDTVGKVTLLRAIAETARWCAPRSWVTEVNWPLWEGPHAPAGRKVAVDEATQAAYLGRYYLAALATGLVERVYWWQLIARGYGLVAPEGDGRLRRRPSFEALATLVREIDGATSLGPLAGPDPARLYLFRRADGAEVVAGWSVDGPCEVPAPSAWLDGRAGVAENVLQSRIHLTDSVEYFNLASQLSSQKD